MRPSSGEKLCLNCLFHYVESTVLRTVRKYELIKEGDRVGVAVSGGKDSLTLLYLLGRFRLMGKLRIQLFPFSINEGHPFSCYYRTTRIDFVSKLSRELGVEYRVFSFKELFGFTAMELAHELWARGEETHMCTIDGVLRRKAMNIIGRELGLTKIATGHNLDDEAQTVLLNVITNDVKRFAWFGPAPSVDREEEGLIPRIKPLRFLREEEIAIYAYYHGIPLMEAECPFVYSNPRYDLKFTLARWEKSNPNIKYSIVSFGDSLSRIIRSETPLGKCRFCGDPASSDICRACQLVSKAGFLDKYLAHLRSLRLTETQPPS